MKDQSFLKSMRKGVQPLRFIVLDVPNPAKPKKVIEELTPVNDTSKILNWKDNKPPYNGPKWWAPFRCRKTNTIHTKNGSVGMCCGSRSCLTCHQRKIRRSVSAMGEMKRYRGSSMYALVFTPENRIQNSNDVDKFLTSFRSLLRKWQRTHGLKFGYWVAETVIKEDEKHTNINCPIGQHLEPEYQDLEERLHQNCKNGISCPICHGTGKIPAVHLHIHLVVCCDSFWYGNGETPEKYINQFYDFNGMGFYGFVKSHGLGVAKSQLLKTRQGMMDYISKACLSYMSKVNKDEDNTSSIDWKQSQRGAMVASFIYGRKRHRGACGDIYGILKRSKDPENYVSFSYGNSLINESNISEVFGNGYTPKEIKDSSGPGSAKTQYIEFLSLGLKAQRNLDLRIDPSKVLIKTELDILKNTYYALTGGSKLQKVRTVKSRYLSKKWENIPVIQSVTCWFRLDGSNIILGRGSSMITVPIKYYVRGGIEYLFYLLESVRDLPYCQWYTLQFDPFD